VSDVHRCGDTGERRRTGDVPQPITALIDEATILSIAEQAWLALVGEEEYLLPLPGGHPDDAISAWVEIVGPWTGSVVLTTARSTAEQLARCLLEEHAPPVLEDEDIEDALGELANVIGGNVKAVLPGPSVLGLPEVGVASAADADVCRVDLLWRGQSLTISAQGFAGVLTEEHNPQKIEVPL
jgi:chemotaxis protein CheX